LNKWDQVNLVFYNIIPFLIMITFNSLLIINLRKKISNFNYHGSNSKAKRPNLTFSLILVSFFLMAITIPSTILFAYFYDQLLADLNISLIYLIDDISFLNNSMLFFICFLSNKKFRTTVIQLCCCKLEKSSKFTGASAKK